MLRPFLFCLQETSISESFSANSSDQPNCIELEDSPHCSREKSSAHALKKKKSHQTHAFAKDLEVLKALAEKRPKEKKKYAWLGEMISNQMDDLNTEDQAAACWEVQGVMNKYVQKSLQAKNRTVPVSSPLPQNGVETAVESFDGAADNLVGGTSETSIEFLLDEDEFNDELYEC